MARKLKPKAAKINYVGAPAIFVLEAACHQITDSFGFNCYHVGSSTERPDWRDVDIRCILDDDEFEAMFPKVSSIDNASWEFDPRWLLLTSAISSHLAKLTGLPVDFQFQPRTFANKHHAKPRHPIGLRIAKGSDEALNEAE